MQEAHVAEKHPQPGYSLGLDELDTSQYRITSTTTDIRSIETAEGGTRDLSSLRDDIEFSEIMLVAEVARYLNKSPLEVEELLNQSAEGMADILVWVNRANRILYEIVIPRLFKHLYEIEEYQGPKHKVRKLLVKDPPNGEEGYTMRVDPALFIEESTLEYSTYKDKSFHLSGYGFDSTPELEFFRQNLPNLHINKLWFTGMLTAGQTEFNVHYIDPNSNALRTYYPDFLLELDDGTYLIVEIKGDHMIDDPVTQAKKSYAERMAEASRMRYRLIPGSQAGRRIEVK